MDIRIIELLDPLFEHVRFDQKKAQSFYQFQVEFVNKNEEHMMFFGGNLLGTQPVRFTITDFNRFFDEVLQVDLADIAEAVKADSNFNPKYKVASDPFNIICFYCAHRFLKSPYLSKDKQHRAAIDAILIFQYRVISSLLSWYFKFPADPKIAYAAYSALSGRFLIKKLNSWQEVFNYRAQEILKDDSIHRKSIETFNDDIKIIYMIADSQGRIRDMVKNIYEEFIRVHVSGEKIDISSLHDLTLDGQEVIRDKIHGPDNYTQYLLSVIPDNYTFIKEELLAVVIQAMATVSVKAFRQMLVWFSNELHGIHRKDIETFIHEVMIYSITYLNKNGSILHQTKDIGAIAVNIRNLYLASRSTDDHLKSIRDLGSKIIKAFNPKLGEAQNSTIRTSLILYLTLRAFTKHHYHG